MPLILYHRQHLAAAAAPYEPWCALRPSDTIPEVDEPALWLDDAGRHQGLALLMPGFSDSFFITDEVVAQRRQGQGLLLKACGQGGKQQTLLDPFAGYGLDAMCLAEAGFTVTAIERERVVWLLLQDAVARQGLELQTLQDDGVEVLARQPQQWDVVYLDPMFPQRNKRALPNRGLQHLQALTQKAPDAMDLQALLTTAQGAARNRVVLKRRAKDPVTGKPAFQVKGQTVRFDVYV
ncbi:MAG: class I SAM-dependent methyltransferase [bacterium]